MNLVVPDSSVMVKWLNSDKEQYLEESSKLLMNAIEGKVDLLVPELAKYEVGNVLLTSKKLTPKEANISLETLYNLPITFITETPNLSKQAFELAYNNKLTYYDAAFMSLAKEYDATLVTDNIKHQGKSSEIKVVSLKNY